MAYNILVVDDSLPMRAVIKKVVKASGFDVGSLYEAANGREALGVLKDSWIDLILTDYNMPDMDGLELLEAIKKDEILKEIPVVMITTEGSQQRIQTFMDKGAAAYVKKPFTPDEIKSKLSQIMGEPEDGQEGFDGGDEEFDF